MEAVRQLGFVAIVGISTLISISGLFFPRTLLNELRELSSLKAKLKEELRKSKEARESAGETVAAVQQLQKANASPHAIAFLNCEVVTFLGQAERAYRKALSIGEEIESKIAHIKATYRDIETAREAVKKAEVLVAQVQDIENEQSAAILQELRNMGIPTDGSPLDIRTTAQRMVHLATPLHAQGDGANLDQDGDMSTRPQGTSEGMSESTSARTKQIGQEETVATWFGPQSEGGFLTGTD